MTAPHISDELPRMLTGEADRDTVLASAAHLRDCVDCQHELVSALVAHASLTSAHRFAPEIVSGLWGNVTDAPTDEPLPALDFSKARADEDARPGGRHGASNTAPPPLPDLSAVFAQVRAEAAAESAPATVVPIRPARAGRLRLAVGAAAAAIVVGGAGVVYGVTSGNDSTSTANPPGRTVALAAYGIGKTAATAKVGAGTIAVDATSLPQLAGKRYEVWLTNSRRTQLQPVGWIGRDGKAAMTVPVDLLTKYTNVEVSVQNLNADDYTYSGVSVLRGSIA